MARKVKQEKRLSVRSKVSYNASLCDVEGTKEEVLVRIRNLFISAKKSLHIGKEWTPTSVLRLEVNHDLYDYDYGESHPHTELEMIHERLENDKEYADRQVKEALYQSTIEAKERADLARLRKKYGNLAPGGIGENGKGTGDE